MPSILASYKTRSRTLSVFAILVAFLAGGILCGWTQPAYSVPDTTTAADSVVTFNEVMYNPPGDGPGEWVELYNQMSVDIDLSNWRVEGGIDFKFPSGSIVPAQGYVVVASDPGAFTTIGITNVFGPFSGHLSNGGETLRLRNNNGRIMDEMSFKDSGSWPVAADGSGASLAKKDVYSASSPGANWRASAQVGGTPGRLNFPDSSQQGPIYDSWVKNTDSGWWSIPRDNSLGQTWTLENFNATNQTGWQAGSSALGYDLGTTGQTPTAMRAYSFDGTLADVSGHGFDAQNSGAVYSAATPPSIAAGQSMHFSSRSQVTVPDSVNPSGYTIAAWVCLDVVQSCSLVVRTDASGPDATWSHQLRINSAGRFEHYLWDGSQHIVAATNVIVPGVWYHVAGTATNNGAMRIYVNGISSGGSDTFGTLWPGGNQWRFGTDSGHTPNFLAGYLDEVAIWHAVLSASDIARLASGVVPMALSGYGGLYSTDVISSMYRTNSSLLMRVPFFVQSGGDHDQMNLGVHYADGFVAYLNGTEIARRNAPAQLTWNSTATTNRARADALKEEMIDVSASLGAVHSGENILAIQALSASPSAPAFLMIAELTARVAPADARWDSVAFSEVAGTGAPGFFVELMYGGVGALPLSGCRIVSSSGNVADLTGRTLAGGGFLALSTNDLGFASQSGDKLFLLGPGGRVLDGAVLGQRLQGRVHPKVGEKWLYPASPTPGAPNRFAFQQGIVINEIMFQHAPAYQTSTNGGAAVMVANDEQWIELYNRSSQPISMSGWKLEGLISFDFPAGTLLKADSYLVIGNNAAALASEYPDIVVLGDFKGQLSHRGGRVALVDDQGNPANELTYYADTPWPGYAAGGGSSMELRNPRSDNSVPESWAASDETGKSSWRHYTYQARAHTPVYTPAIYSFDEFRLGLLGEGEALVDNINVVDIATGVQLLQNPNFTSGTTAWRLAGNHSHSRAEASADGPSSPVLHLVATGPTTYLENQLETTLKSGGVLVPVVDGHTYQVSFDAKWLAGSPQLHTELYYNKVAETTILEQPVHGGTPGRRNSTYTANAGPTYTGVRHSPVVPTSSDVIQVSAWANDPDGVKNLQLRFAINDGAWQTAPMTVDSADPAHFTGTIPAQPSETVVQFYIQGTDSLGAVSTYPGGGINSRALIKVGLPQMVAGKTTLRTILTPSDSTRLYDWAGLMSDDLLGCTVIHNESEIFYDSHLRLHGSMFSRTDASSAGLSVKLPSDHLYRGSRPSVIARRSDLVTALEKHILVAAGGVPANYADLIHLVSHRPDNVGTATLNLANYDNTYVDSQFENDNGGTVFKLEGIRVYMATADGTPEGYKVPQPVDFVWDYDITDLGLDPEQYRWGLLICSRHAADDFSSVVAMGRAFGLSGTALQKAAPGVIDVDEWARYFALQTLLGVADIYGVDNPHNVAFYARPSDKKMVILQNDWGFGFQVSSSGSIYGKNKIYEILQFPENRRLYQGHLLQLINSVYNSQYLSRWAQHFSQTSGTDCSGVPGYAEARGASVRAQLAPRVSFAITSGGGHNLSVNTPSVTLNGTGWIDVHDIKLAGTTNSIAVTWLDDHSWQLTLPVKAGTNVVQLVASDFLGTNVGQATIVVTSTVSGFVQRDYLRISELMYDPAAVSASEIAAGFTDNEDFEFIEIINTGPTNVPLAGVRFTAGVTFDFTGSAITNLASGARALLVAKKSAFTLRYGSGLPVAGAYSGHLNNAGELVRWIDSFGNVIQEFTYKTGTGWPSVADGTGVSLEALDLNGDYGNPANWQASVSNGGTPGTRGMVRPSFTSAVVDGSSVRLRFNAVAGQAYTIYWRDAIDSGVWMVLQTFPAGESSRAEEAVDSLPTEGARRFYQLATE